MLVLMHPMLRFAWEVEVSSLFTVDLSTATREFGLDVLTSSVCDKIIFPYRFQSKFHQTFLLVAAIQIFPGIFRQLQIDSRQRRPVFFEIGLSENRLAFLLIGTTVIVILMQECFCRCLHQLHVTYLVFVAFVKCGLHAATGTALLFLFLLNIMIYKNRNDLQQ